MFRKVSLRILVYILVILTVLTIITQIAQKMGGESTFRSDLAAFDTAKVTSLAISDLKNGNKNVELEKSGHSWKMKAGGRDYRTDDNYINNLLWELTQVKAERIAANSKSKWKEYEVTDSLALRITVKGKSKILADLMMGKFSYQPQQGGNPYNQQGKMTSYVRIADEKEVYAVNGFLRASFSPEIDRFRDRTIVRAVAGNLKKLTFQYPADSSFVLEKQDNAWIAGGIKADSAKASQYISSLEHMTGGDFADNVLANGQARFRLTIEGASSMPVDISAFDADSLNGQVIISSLNPGAQFSGKSGLTGRIFRGKSSFLK